MNNRKVINLCRTHYISMPVSAIAGRLSRVLLVIAAFTSCSFCVDQAALDHQLFQAVAKGDMGAVRVLLDNGANIEAKDERGETPLFTAVENHNPEMTKFLLEKHADISARDNYGDTVLIEPVRSMNPDMLRLLLAASSDVKARSDALLEAAHEGPVIVQVVEAPELPARPNARANPTEPPWVTNARLLIESGAGIEARDEDGDTPLMLAASYGQAEIFELLLESGAKTNVRNKRGMTPLIGAACACAIATMNSTYDIMKLLLEKKANVNARDHEGRTPLMMAAGSPDGAPSVGLLLSHGADPMAKDNKGQTALDFAKDSPFPEKIQLLKKAVAKSRQGKPALP